jgi:hypothetical protein
VETDVDGIGWGEYLRVRIRLDIMKPLARGRVLKLNGESSWIEFQYERLPTFCFRCGVIQHGAGGVQPNTGLSLLESPHRRNSVPG